MSDDERIARLEELAWRVYGPKAWLHVAPARSMESATVYESEGDGANVVLRVEGARCLDALEAALLVVADEAPPLLVLEPDGTVHPASEPTWVEQLAADMEAEASRLLGDLWPQDEHDARVALLQRWAAELRARAKGGERG